MNTLIAARAVAGMGGGGSVYPSINFILRVYSCRSTLLPLKFLA